MASVYERRRSLAKLFQDLPTGFVAAVRPDHPLLFRAADILVGGLGLMTALFVPTAAERRNPSLLTTRFVLNRLALAPHTRHVLVIERGDERLAGQLEHHFDAVVEWNDRENVTRLSQDREFRSCHEELPPETVAAVRQQYADALQITHTMRWLDERRQRGTRQDGSLDAQLDTKSRSKPSLERDDIIMGDDRVPIARFTAGRVTSAAILEIVNDQTERLYDLDSGVPYRNLHVLPGMAIVETLPIYPSDPDKVVRAAAFGGWALVRQDQERSVPRLAHRLTERWHPTRRTAAI